MGRFESLVALRYLKARRQSSFVSAISLISVLGVMVGVCAMVVVLSVMAGFENDLREKIVGTNAHINVFKLTPVFSGYRPVLDTVRSTPGVRGASPFILREAMLSSQSNVTGCLLKGIDPETAGQVIELDRYLAAESGGTIRDLLDPDRFRPKSPAPIPETGLDRQPGAVDGSALDRILSSRRETLRERSLPGIFIGRELSKHLNVYVGDEVNLVNPIGGGISPAGPIPSNRWFRVAGVFYSGMYEYDMKFVYTTIAALQEFSSLEDEVTAIEIRVDTTDIFRTREIGRELMTRLGGFPYDVKDWMDMNRNLFSALKLERAAMFVILTFITLVAAFNIMSTLIMLVLQKTREIAILKSIGADDRSIMRIFVIDGMIIGGIGTLLGLLLGLLLCLAIERIGIPLDEEVYYIHTLPVEMDPLHFGVVAASAMAICLVATIYPSRQAARMDPVAGLREEI